MLDVNAQFNYRYGFRMTSLLTVSGFPASLILSFLFWDNLDPSFYWVLVFSPEGELAELFSTSSLCSSSSPYYFLTHNKRNNAGGISNSLTDNLRTGGEDARAGAL